MVPQEVDSLGPSVVPSLTSLYDCPSGSHPVYRPLYHSRTSGGHLSLTVLSSGTVTVVPPCATRPRHRPVRVPLPCLSTGPSPRGDLSVCPVHRVSVGPVRRSRSSVPLSLRTEIVPHRNVGGPSRTVPDVLTGVGKSYGTFRGRGRGRTKGGLG